MTEKGGGRGGAHASHSQPTHTQYFICAAPLKNHTRQKKQNTVRLRINLPSSRIASTLGIYPIDSSPLFGSACFFLLFGYVASTNKHNSMHVYISIPRGGVGDLKQTDDDPSGWQPKGKAGAGTCCITA